MKRNLLILLLIAMPIGMIAQPMVPCSSEAKDTEQEMRVLGVGAGETVYDATFSAVSDALQQIKTRLEEREPSVEFDYNITKSFSTQGEQLEIDTPLGQPNVVCNEIQQPDEGGFVVYLVLSMEMQAWDE